MKTALALTILWLAVGVFAQQARDSTGEIHGVVVGNDGQPAKGMRLEAQMQCPGPGACAFWRSKTTTNQSGEYRFQHLPVGYKYDVFADNTKAGYPRFAPAAAGSVEVTIDHPVGELRVSLPPKAGFLNVHATDRRTGVIIPRVLIKLKALDVASPRWSEQWADGSGCLFSPDCAIPVPPDKPLLVHVSAAGFKEWDESAGKGKLAVVHSDARLTWDIQLEPLPH